MNADGHGWEKIKKKSIWHFSILPGLLLSFPSFEALFISSGDFETARRTVGFLSYISAIYLGGCHEPYIYPSPTTTEK
jgi:hypothetical protein